MKKISILIFILTIIVFSIMIIRDLSIVNKPISMEVSGYIISFNSESQLEKSKIEINGTINTDDSYLQILDATIESKSEYFKDLSNNNFQVTLTKSKKYLPVVINISDEIFSLFYLDNDENIIIVHEKGIESVLFIGPCYDETDIISVAEEALSGTKYEYLIDKIDDNL